MEISKRYEHHLIEDKWYKHWEDNKLFSSTPDEREPYTIVIPPPNVTGILHMGHVLNNTIQDVLIRRARKSGKNACWVPGMDHASIATEAKVVKWLRSEMGIKKSDIGREEFIKYAWKWTDKYGGIILSQLKKLGASCDWDRTAFTMDKERYDSVIKTFVDLYKKGKLYRDYRMINWDPDAQTVLSNEEVIYSDENSKLYKVQYKIKDSDETITIATTRPETILGDTAIAVHPDDDRYKHIHNKIAIVPKVNREIPIIADDYVDREFGTGALKITPAHDPNDYEIGKKHKLEIISVIADNGTISPEGKFYVGDDRYVARKAIVKDLEENNQILDIENYRHSVGRSERTNAVVEPKLSLQWYVDMKGLAGPALTSVMTDELRFYPEKMKNTYSNWMDNIRDWCISRQLWWGQRIPAYYVNGNSDRPFVGETIEEALEIARKELKSPDLKLSDLSQDEDVLDTWFSSWIWPITVFNGFSDPKELDYYYPTSTLVTGWDIIFLWVARMIMAGHEYQNEKPFKQVYFTGMVRDKLKRKMSKSLGNSPDPLDLIAEYGADSVRFGILSSSPAGGDLLFEDKLCEQGRNFTNKLWNALRLIKGWEPVESLQPNESEQLAMNWFDSLISDLRGELDQNFEEFRLSEALISVYSFAWSDFCSWYLEMIKPANGNTISENVYDRTIRFFDQICDLLHPFMPFITEEIWSQLRERGSGDLCITNQYNVLKEVDKNLLNDMSVVKEIISKTRDIRNQFGLKQREPLNLVATDTSSIREFLSNQGVTSLLIKMAFLENIEFTSGEVTGSSFLIGTHKFAIPIESNISVEEELEKLKSDLNYQEGFIKSVNKKLENERFISNAPPQVVDNERKKLADGLKRINLLKEEIKSLEKDV